MPPGVILSPSCPKQRTHSQGQLEVQSCPPPSNLPQVPRNVVAAPTVPRVRRRARTPEKGALGPDGCLNRIKIAQLGREGPRCLKEKNPRLECLGWDPASAL